MADDQHRVCPECDWEGSVDDLDPVADPMERLGPNPHVLLPDGDCPECGAMVYDPADVREARIVDAKVDAHSTLIGLLRQARNKLFALGSADPLVEEIDSALLDITTKTNPGDGVH